jgi:hypothetical protein
MIEAWKPVDRGFELGAGGSIALPAPGILVPTPRIVLPPLRLPRWTLPWTRSKEDLVVAAIGTPTDLGHNNRTGSFSTVVLTLTASVATGTKIWVTAASGGSTATSLTISDSKGNTWTTDALWSTSVPLIGLASCDVTNALVSGDTITATWNATVNTDYFIHACYDTGLATGLGTATPFAIHASGASWNAATAGNLTTTATSEILIGAGVRAANTTSTPSGSNVEIADWSDGSRNVSVVYQIVSPGTAAPGGVFSSSGTWSGVGASYKIGGGTTTKTLSATETTVLTLAKTVVKVLF